VLAAVTAAPGGAVGGFQVHGIGLAKGCQSPTKVGDPYLCLYVITNNQDTAHDSLTFNSVVDTVQAFGGGVSQGNILSSLTWHLSGGAFCDGIPVNGSGQVTSGGKCTLPYLATASSDLHSQYSPTGADYVNLPQHTLRDTVQLTWRDTCVPSDGTPASSNCVANTDFFPTTGSQSLIQQLDSIVWTEVHTPQEQAVIVVAAGTTVHDFVTVTGEPGKPNPSGNVTIDWFLNSVCSGSPQSKSTPFALAAHGQ